MSFLNFNQIFITFASVQNYVIVGSKGAIYSFMVLSMYLASIVGVGRYSCHCAHASEIAVLGASSKCSCVEEIKKEDPDHHCICGAQLVTKEPKRDDCCSVKYFFLDSDQNTSTNSCTVSVIDTQSFKTFETNEVSASSVVCPRIKTYQALFHRVTGSLFEKNKQLLL